MTNDFDALTQDVGIGGVRTRLGIRVLLCYILKNVGSEISRTSFGEILRSSELVNFFEINPALDWLYENRLVSRTEKDDDDYFTITDEGISVAEKLQTEIPLTAREKALAVAFSVVTRRMPNQPNRRIKPRRSKQHVLVRLTSLSFPFAGCECIRFSPFCH